jgi:hypothetical protein
MTKLIFTIFFAVLINKMKLSEGFCIPTTTASLVTTLTITNDFFMPGDNLFRFFSALHTN